MICKTTDGREVDSYSEDWKLETLARFVWDIKPSTRRQEWVAEFAKGKPPEVMQALRQRMLAIQAAKRGVPF